MLLILFIGNISGNSHVLYELMVTNALINERITCCITENLQNTTKHSIYKNFSLQLAERPGFAREIKSCP